MVEYGKGYTELATDSMCSYMGLHIYIMHGAKIRRPCYAANFLDPRESYTIAYNEL